MADNNINENKGKSSDQAQTLKDFRDALEISKDFVRSRFETAVRMYRLFAGQLPDELNGTFSKVMLWFPYSIINKELATSMKTMLEGGEWFNVTADTLKLEPTADVAQKWLKYQMEKVQKFTKTALPTFQNSYIFGNGFRFYGHHYKEIKETVENPKIGLMGVREGYSEQDLVNEVGVITGQHVNFFNVFPSPNGGIINPAVDTLEAGLDYLIVNMYMGEDFIKREVERGNFNKEEAGKLLARGGKDAEDDPSYEYKTEMISTDSSWSQFTAPEWASKVRNAGTTLPTRRRLSWFFRRNKWSIIGEDKYVLYDGPPLLDKWPVANFKHSFNVDNFYGFSLLETVEDLIISMIHNFNMRFDYLADKFHPPRFVPQQLVDDLGGDMGKLDWSPYSTHVYQHRAFPGGLDKYMISDTKPELTPQAFVEQGQMQQYLEDIISQHGNQSMNANTATVGSLLSSDDAAPKMLRAITNEITGVQDSIELTLMLGAKYKKENEIIRTGAEGMPWEEIDHTAITDGYGIEVTGARHMAQADEIFKKQMSIAPMLLNNPAIRGQVEMSRQLLEGGGFKNIDTIMNGSPSETPPSMPQGEAQMPGGIPSLQNQTASVNGRSGPGQQSAMSTGV